MQFVQEEEEMDFKQLDVSAVSNLKDFKLTHGECSLSGGREGQGHLV